MYRTVFAMALVAAVFLTSSVPAVEMVWDGGDGFWNADNWNGGMTPVEVVGRSDGTRGSEDTIIIGDGNVLYEANDVQSDFQMRQGNTLTITGGASWTQLTLPEWSENRWTEMDLSELVLDNGTFNRLGSKPGEGGGALLLGSWRGDDNFDIIPPPQEINIDITNGGGLMNEGQLWFGGWEDHPFGLIVNVTINDGFLDLTGGDVPGVGDEADADLVFIFDIDEDGQHSPAPGDPKMEDYNVNFTGPGSITVDSSGIIAPIKVEQGGVFVWTNLEPITYEDLWLEGIIQANGLSGPDGEEFSEYFRVEGDLGSDDYRLVSLLPGDVVAGDANGDGVVNAADLNVVGGNWQMEVAGGIADGDFNEDGFVDASDLNILGGNWQFGVGNPAAVPEPSAAALLLMALLGFGGIRHQRQR